jgi:hypothetical protein
MMSNNKFDLPSFWVGMTLGILLLGAAILGSRMIGDYHTIVVPDICDYEEDNCYPEYDADNGWSIIEGERP